MYVRFCTLVFCTFAVSTGAALAQPLPHTASARLWHHQGPNYSDDLLFPDSGSDDGDHNHERSVRKMPRPLPDSYRSACHKGYKRLECKVKHVSGGGHCEAVGWGHPEDETDCGCVVHVGANIAEWDQVCRVTVLEVPIKDPGPTVPSNRCKGLVCFLPNARPPFPWKPVVPVSQLPFTTVWAWAKNMNQTAMAFSLALDRAGQEGASAIAGLQAHDGDKYLAAFQDDMQHVTGLGKELLAENLKPLPFAAGVVDQTYYQFITDLIWFQRPTLPSRSQPASCLRATALLDAVDAYVAGVATGALPASLKALQDINALLHCMPAVDALRFNYALARTLEFRARTPELRTQLEVSLLPLIVLVLDVTKAAGVTPLQRQIIMRFADYVQAWNVPDSVVQRMGLWIPQPISGDLKQVRNFCEANANPCVSGLGILRGLTDPLALGLADCSMEQMIAGGLSPSGAYACRQDACVAAAAKLRRLSISGLPLAIGNAVAAGVTQQGVPLDAPPLLSQCGLDGSGNPSGSGGGAPDSLPGPAGRCFIGRTDKTPSFYQCVSRAVQSTSGPFGATASAPPQPKVAGDTCTRGEDEPASQPSTQPVSDPNLEKAKKTVADNLQDPAVIEDIKRVTAGWVDPNSVAKVAKIAADDLTGGWIPIKPMQDGKQPSGPDPWAAFTDYFSITYDKDFTDKAAPGSSGELANVLTHEMLHIIFGRLGFVDQTQGAVVHHFWMDISHITWPKACQQAGCNQPDPESNTCSAVSFRVKQLMSCQHQLSSPRPPRPVDPSPLDDNGKAVFSTCMPQALGISSAPNCGYLDCGPEGSTFTGGRCACKVPGKVASGRFSVIRCGALDCGANGTLVTGPGTCSCAPNAGSVSINAAGLIERTWGPSVWTAPSLGGLRLAPPM